MHQSNFTRLMAAALALLLGTSVNLRAEVRLPRVFSSHMVLQQQKPIIIWGWAQPGEKLTVRLASASQETQANEAGEWKVTLPALTAGGPYTLSVEGASGKVQFEDVMVGEVWLCAGQSNMEMGVGMVHDGKQEVAAADYPGIRLLMVQNSWKPEPQKDIDGEWKVCSPKTIAEGGWNGFSASGYFFGRELHKKLGVTVGLIDSTWGGTRIESWTPPEGFAAVPALQHDYELVQLADPRTAVHEERLRQVLDQTEKWLASARQSLDQHQLVLPMPVYPVELLAPHDVQNSTALFNAMIHPLCPLAIRGAIWYQGESNHEEGKLYTERMKALISGWRKIWGEGDFPFYFVQIAPFNYGSRPEGIGEFWEAQTEAQSIPNTGMAVINDIGDLKDIHPTNKQEVGRRLALWALAKTYGQNGIVYSGPTFKSMAIEGDKLRISFDNMGGGLSSRDGKPLDWFEIIDADEGGFVHADAQIDGATILLSTPGVKHPVAMRFAWSMMAEPNLKNADGLPAGAFRAGEVPKRDPLSLNVPEARTYELVYDLDLSKLNRNITYDEDNHQRLAGRAFDRIAYCMELTGADGKAQFVYVSMNAFTDDLNKIGVPTPETGAHFQQSVSAMNVWSSVKSVVSGTNLGGGNIEFWPNNYGPNNSAGVPNASNDTYDFGDVPTDPLDGYGSMQVHNHDAKQTIFALNHWVAANAADLGIGNQPTNNPDWTFAGNAASWQTRRLRVFVHFR